MFGFIYGQTKKNWNRVCYGSLPSCKYWDDRSASTGRCEICISADMKLAFLGWRRSQDEKSLIVFPRCTDYQSRVIYSLVSIAFIATMNSLIQRFADSGAAYNLQKRSASIVDGDDDCSDAMWGSLAGYGSLPKGVPSFLVPQLPDVSLPSHVSFIVSSQQSQLHF